MNRKHAALLLLLTIAASWRSIGLGLFSAKATQAPITVGVNFSLYQQFALGSQLQSQWCWAACISMLYSYYGHPVSQARIVSEVYGAPVNMPAMAGIVMARQLNRSWQDDAGGAFNSYVTAAYDVQAGVNNINNYWILSQLQQNKPIIMGAGGHAMVLLSLSYYPGQLGPNVVQGVVFDPWPGRGIRYLTAAELTPMNFGGSLSFLASVDIQ